MTMSHDYLLIHKVPDFWFLYFCQTFGFHWTKDQYRLYKMELAGQLHSMAWQAVVKKRGEWIKQNKMLSGDGYKIYSDYLFTVSWTIRENELCCPVNMAINSVLKF